MTDASGWPVCIIESPFRGDMVANRKYAIRAALDCLQRQEVPYASHLFFPQFLDEMTPHERETGLTAGYAMWWSAAKIAFYVDRGWSSGMQRAHERANKLGYVIEIRVLEESNQEKTSEHRAGSVSDVPAADARHDFGDRQAID